jgi:hypothetical protein
VRKVALVFAVVVALGGLFFLLRPRDESASSAPPSPVGGHQDHLSGQGTPGSSHEEPLEFDFTIKRGTVEGPDEVQVPAGAVVHLNVTSDEAGEAHVHGFEVLTEVEPGREKAVMVEANAAGRYDVEFHGHGGTSLTITELVVTP